jgi:hypothetical protein
MQVPLARGAAFAPRPRGDGPSTNKPTTPLKGQGSCGGSVGDGRADLWSGHEHVLAPKLCAARSLPSGQLRPSRRSRQEQAMSNDVQIQKTSAKPVAATPARPATWDPFRTMRELMSWGTFPAWRQLARTGAREYGSFTLHPLLVAEPDVLRGWKDDLLRLLFACCHPALEKGESAGLALATVVGLSTSEVASLSRGSAHDGAAPEHARDSACAKRAIGMGRPPNGASIG